MPSPITLTEPGEFLVGCNYVPSHAGTHMWSDWRPEVIDRDLGLLEEAGLQIVRVLLMWPDFQPLHLLRGGGGAPAEFRFGEEPLPDDDYGRAGVSPEAMDRFAQFLDLAEKHGLKVIVGLITGWMSGRMYVPPAFEGLDVLTDPVAIQWELRFVRCFVGAFKGHAAIAGWDLGNECNCMGSANREQAYTWTATIANAIRVADPAHPVVSGMHGLSPTGTWRMQDQAELTDLLCVHPYPVFTPHCDQDPVNTIRTILHGTAEARLYADIGGKPCLCEEMGTLGPVIASEAIAGDYTRSCLFSLWANDCHGLMWWCANDLTQLGYAPYDWHSVERELGLLRLDGTAKPALQAMTAFRRFLDTLPFDRLPQRTREAVCILSDGQDHWGVAYSSFILAKQAGFDLEFQFCDQPIREAPLYLLPCLNGHAMISRRRMTELLEKVEAGATLYISLDTGLPSSFEAITGLEPQTRERRRDFGQILLDGLGGQPKIPCGGAFKVRLKPTRAEVLGREADGNPAFTVAEYGKGQVYFLSVPMEMMLTQTPGAFHTPDAAPCRLIYRHIATEAVAGRAIRKTHPAVALTEHPLSDTRRVIVAINQSPEAVAETLPLAEGWALAEVYTGDVSADNPKIVTCALPANDGAAFVVERR
jgi:endo-1,4-beta-mannosidase